MLKQINIFFLSILFFCSGCSNEVDKNALPTFDPIDVDENTIFLVNSKDDNVHKIYAIDTRNNRKIYTYEFKNKIIYDLVFDASFDMNPYIILLSGEAFKIDVKSGKLKRIDTDIEYNPQSISLVDNKLWLIPPGGGTNNSKKYIIYDSKKDQLENIVLPEGFFYGAWARENNNIYLNLNFISSQPKVYNMTAGKNIDYNLLRNDYDFFYFYQNKYLVAAIKNSSIVDTYRIDSFQPIFKKEFLFSIDSSKTLIFPAMFEDNDCIYLVSREYVTKRSKSKNYEIEKTVTFYNKSSGGSFGFYCKNGYIWLTSEENDGAYKVNMDDLSYEIIK